MIFSYTYLRLITLARIQLQNSSWQNKKFSLERHQFAIQLTYALLQQQGKFSSPHLHNQKCQIKMILQKGQCKYMPCTLSVTTHHQTAPPLSFLNISEGTVKKECRKTSPKTSVAKYEIVTNEAPITNI